jgi:acetyl/propionyl-CoA carboxylase alpha subunit
MRYRAIVSGAELECELEQASWPYVSAVIAGKSWALRLTEVTTGVYWFDLEGRSFEAVVVPFDDGYRVRIGDKTFDVTIENGRRRQGAGSQRNLHRAEIRAPMPGRVVRLLVSEGDRVESGQGVFILEAMKMQNEVKAPRDGTVGSVDVGEGSSVNAGALLATIE